MMECDYTALIDYARELNKEFNLIKKNMESIENSFENIKHNSDWSGVVQYYFMSEYKKMIESYNNLANKFNNINQYIDQVINNYITFETAMSTAFGG